MSVHPQKRLLTAQLYDNEENTTECDKMQHIQKNLRDTQVPRHPDLTSSQSISEAAQNAGVSPRTILHLTLR